MTKKQYAIVFPGQGSQSIGMLSEFAKQYPVVEDTFQEASSVLGYDLWKVVQTGPQEQLNSTEITQPAVLSADIAMWRIWQALTASRPTVLAGHSLGEYAALVASEVLAFGDAVSLVAKRGAFMQAAVPSGVGAMAAIIGLNDQDLQGVCRQASQGEIVSAANYNSTGQTVIAGHTAAVERAMSLAKEAGAKLTKLIPVSVPSHSPLMQSAADQLAIALRSVSVCAPKIPVLHNVDVATHDAPSALIDVLIKQLTEPVRWVETIQALSAENISSCIECGPGKVLTGLIKRIDRQLETWTTDTIDNFHAACTAVT